MKEILANITTPIRDEKLQTPDLEIFQPPPVLPGNNCNGNLKAIFVDIYETDDGGLEFIFCTLLDYNSEGVHSADGLFDNLEESINLELESGYVLKGALSTGVKITVQSLTEPPIVELDPIMIQIYSGSDLSGSASLGLFTSTISGSASLQGSLSIGYCTVCDGVYPTEGYERAGETSSFYFSHLIGYRLDGGLELMAGIEGAALGVGVRLGIEDENIFDDNPADIQFPDAQFIKDSVKFSPENAVSKLSGEKTMSTQHRSKILHFFFCFRYAAAHRHNNCTGH